MKKSLVKNTKGKNLKDNIIKIQTIEDLKELIDKHFIRDNELVIFVVLENNQ